MKFSWKPSRENELSEAWRVNANRPGLLFLSDAELSSRGVLFNAVASSSVSRSNKIYLFLLVYSKKK